MRLGVLLAALFLMTFMTPLTAQAEACEVRVQHAGNVIQGKRVYSHFLVGHSPWRWATVSFRYRLTYLDEDNQEGTIEGRFRDIIRSDEEEYVELKNLRQRPTHVTETTISDITCAK